MYTEMMIELPAGLSALRDFNHSAPKAKLVANTHIVLQKPARANVFSKRARLVEQRVDKILRRKMGNPLGIMFCWIKMHRFVRAAVHYGIGDFISLKAILAQKDRSVHRRARHGAHRAVGVKRFGLPDQQNIYLT